MSNVSRRAVMAGAMAAGATAASVIGPTKAMAAQGTAAAFADAPTGSFDDSSILKDAAMHGKILGPGPYYVSGTGLDLSGFSLIGIPGQTTITIMGETFISASDRLGRIYVDGITFNCDSKNTKSVIRCTSTLDDVTYFKTITNCLFRDFKGPALSFNQSDNPYYKIQKCQFSGADSSTSTGIAFADAADQTSIIDCAFTKVVTGIFLGKTGNRTHIEHCDFIHNEKANHNRVNIHIEPSPTLANSGIGLTITGNKFGNENRGPMDYFILYADQGTAVYADAKYPGEFIPKFAATNGYAGLQMVHGNDFSGAVDTSQMRSPITSYIPNLVGCMYGPNVHSGSPSRYEVEFLGSQPTNKMGTRIDTGTSWGTNVGATNADQSLFKITN